jgi:hypothetical protein
MEYKNIDHKSFVNTSSSYAKNLAQARKSNNFGGTAVGIGKDAMPN